MVGRQVSFSVQKEERQPGEVVLDIRNLSVLSSRKVLGLKDVSLQVREGEVLGIAGVDGNGQSELVEAITGMGKWRPGKYFREPILQYVGPGTD